MAFSFNTAHLINHLRASYIASVDDDIYTTRIMKQYKPELEFIVNDEVSNFLNKIHDEKLDQYSDSFQLSESPPIQFDLLNDKKFHKRFNNLAIDDSNGQSGQPNETNGQSKQGNSLIEENEESEDNGNNSIIYHGTLTENSSIHDSINTNSTITPPTNPIELKHTKTLRKSYKPNIARIFRNSHSSNNTSNQSRTDASKSSVAENFSDSDEDDDEIEVIEEEDVDNEDVNNEMNVSQSTILGDEGNIHDENDLNGADDTFRRNRRQFNPNIDFDIDYDDIESISDFTDLDSALESSSLIDSDSFDEDDTDFSDFTVNLATKNLLNLTPGGNKFKRKKFKHSFSRGSSNNERHLKKNSSNGNTSGITGSNIGAGSSNSLKLTKSFKNQSDILTSNHSSRNLVPSQLDSIVKVGTLPKPNLKSNLSELIKEKVMSKKDPLEYYLFAINDGDNSKITNLQVYLPDGPHPSIPFMTIKIRNDIAVSDALGFILYNYNKKESLTSELQNPNRWRLELVDEDGENYGDFGILERTRILATYGSMEVALCKVSESEYEKNEKITPLPFQFYRCDQKDDLNDDDHNLNNDIIELKIFDYPYNPLAFNYTSYFISIQSTILDVLKKISQEKKVVYTKYALRDIGTNYPLNNQQILYDLHTNNLEFVPSEAINEADLTKPSMNLNGSINTLATNITPRFGQLSTTPPRKQLLNRQSRQFNNQNFNRQQQQQQSQQSRLSKATSKYFKEMLNQGAEQLPNATVYLKWTVWRKKSTFINKQEKSLTIDGDYVHLTPSDYRKWDEHSKTSTFHINQIVRIKHYKKAPTQFKIVINKTNGLKRYDLEAKTSKEAIEIVNKLRSIVSAYKINSYSR